jgi:hypothetical protein
LATDAIVTDGQCIRIRTNVVGGVVVAESTVWARARQQIVAMNRGCGRLAVADVDGEAV